MKRGYLLYTLLVLCAWVSPVWATPSLTIDGQNGTIIEGQTFSNASDACLSIANSTNITVRNNKFINCLGNVAIGFNTTVGLTIEHNYFDNVVGGVYATGAQGPISNVTIRNNRFRNTLKAGTARGQCVQFNGVVGTGLRIKDNSCVFTPGAADSFDAINMFNSGGTSADMLEITGNYIEGWSRGASEGGITFGDAGGDYVYVADNLVYMSSAFGIGLAGGNHSVIERNAVYSTQTSLSNNGFIVWNGTAPCDDITFQENTTWWIDKNGVGTHVYLPTSGGDECTNRHYTTTNMHSHLWLTSNPSPFQDRVAEAPGPTYARNTVYWREYEGPDEATTVTHYHVFTCTPAPTCTIDGTGTILAEVTLTPGQVMSWTLPTGESGRVRVYGANSSHAHVTNERSNYLNFQQGASTRHRAIARTARN